MSLRKPLHTRQISCRAYEVGGGLIELEGTLVDTKPEPLRLVTREVPPGEGIHHMRVVLTIDRNRTIVRAQAFTESSPYPECGAIGSAYAQLEGLRIEQGFSKAVKRLFGGLQGCTHITELVAPLASTAFQVLWANADFDGIDKPGSTARNSPIGGCHALHPQGRIVRTYFPHLKETP